MRAPWRWHWGRITGLVALWSGVTLVCSYAPILWLAVAGWVVLWLNQKDPQPLPSPTGSPSSNREEAGQNVETTSESRHGGAQVTVTPAVGRTRIHKTG